MENTFRKKLRLFAEATFLYFLQGIPYGFQAKYLPLLMRRYGYELSSISFVNIISLTWTLKFTWAKLFDRFQGKERLWVSGCLIFLSIALFSFNFQSSIVALFPFLLFLTSFLTASLDIAVDALVIKCFDEKDLGYCNVGQVVGYKFGILFGGGMLTVFGTSLSHFSLISSIIYLLTAIYFTIGDSDLFTTVQSSTTQQQQHVTTTCQTTKNSMLMQIFSSTHQLWLIMFVLFYKVGEQGFVSMYPLRLVDEGMELTHVGMITGIIGQTFSIIGSSLCGLLISKLRIELKSLLMQIGILKWLLLIIYTQQLSSISNNFIIHSMIESLLQLLAGMMTTATFTTMMMTTKSLATDSYAFHFTIVAAFEVLGKLVMKSFAGIATQKLGYDNFFSCCCAIDFVVVLLALFNPTSSFASKRPKTE